MRELYGLNFVGKEFAKRLVDTLPKTLVRKVNIEEIKINEIESIIPGNRNVLIKGDNLETLKHLKVGYRNKIKLIYIDPPYNTNKEFIYNDIKRFSKEDIKNMFDISEEDAEDIYNKLSKLSNSHSAWLTFMYPRLVLARELLRDDGVIFIHIDNTEVAQLKLIMNEIFGEHNFVAQVVWDKGNAQNDADYIQNNHEYILVYAKNITELNIKEFVIKKYNVYKDDNNGFYDLVLLKKGGANDMLKDRNKMGYTIYYNPDTKNIIAKIDYDLELAKTKFNIDEIYTDDEELINQGYIPIRPINKDGRPGCWRVGLDTFNKLLAGRWRVGLDTFNELLETSKIVIKKDGDTYKVYEKKYYNKDEILKIEKIKNIQSKTHTIYCLRKYPFKSIIKFGEGRADLQNLNLDRFFDNPKPVDLIKFYIKNITDQDDIILDFFAGSGTTGEAVIRAALEDKKLRKYILVQLDEPVSKKNKDFIINALKERFDIEENNPTIFDIMVLRINQVINSIKENTPEELKEILDYDIYEIDNKFEDLNITFNKIAERKYESSHNTEDILKHISGIVNNLKNFTEEDERVILYTLLFKQGYTFDTDIKVLRFENYPVYLNTKNDNIFIIHPIEKYNKEAIKEGAKKVFLPMLKYILDYNVYHVDTDDIFIFEPLLNYMHLMFDNPIYFKIFFDNFKVIRKVNGNDIDVNLLRIESEEVINV